MKKGTDYDIAKELLFFFRMDCLYHNYVVTNNSYNNTLDKNVRRAT